GLQLPLPQVYTPAQVHAAAGMSKMPGEARAIPRGGPQANLAVAAGSIGVARPVLERRGVEVQGATAQTAEIRQCPSGLTVRQVLHHVIANDQIEATPGAKIRE